MALVTELCRKFALEVERQQGDKTRQRKECEVSFGELQSSRNC